jgi:hypothetical protein
MLWLIMMGVTFLLVMAVLGGTYFICRFLECRPYFDDKPLLAIMVLSCWSSVCCVSAAWFMSALS